MSLAVEIDTIVFDILGTLVDEPGGRRTAVEALTPAHDPELTRELTRLWSNYEATEHQRVLAGARPYADSAALDREAAELIADRAGVTDPRSVDRLATTTERLEPWPDTATGLARLARSHALIGLSNASRAVLLRLNAHAGLRWHQIRSAEDARTYKPAPEAYQLAIEVAGRPAHRLLKVAAHAWDLRGAQQAGMRTAYLRRPAGDPPTHSDAFDLHADDLDALAEALAAPTTFHNTPPHRQESHQC